MTDIVDCEYRFLNFWRRRWVIQIGFLLLAPFSSSIVLAVQSQQQSSYHESYDDPSMQAGKSPGSLEEPKNSMQVVEEYKKLKALYASGKQQQAILEAVNYLKTHPTDVDTRLVLGQFYLHQKKNQQAQKEFSIALKQMPNYVDVRVNLANAELALNNIQAAFQVIQEGLKINPNQTLLLKKQKDLQGLMAEQKKNSLPQSKLLSKVTEIDVTKVTDVVTNAGHLNSDNHKSFPPSLNIQTVRSLYASGAHEKAINLAKSHLKQKPDDVDIRLVLGQFYQQEKKFDQARMELDKALSQSPNYTDVRLVLINNELETKHYQKALELVNQGLRLKADNRALLEKKKQIENLLQKRSAISTEAFKIKKPEPEMGWDQQNYYVSDLKKIWNYSTVYFSNKTAIGKVIGRLNYADRLYHRGTQVEIALYPVINKYIYLDLDIAFSDKPELFPHRLYAAEGYFSIPKFIDFSIGSRYNNIDSEHLFRVFTGTLSKEFKNERILFRPFYFSPGKGPDSEFNIIDYRHYFARPYHYIGFLYGAGTSPDLDDLQSINFIKIKSKLLRFYWGFSLLNHRLLIKLNIESNHQVFPENHIRNLIGGGISLELRL